jgi:hypothetical protein
MTGPPGPEDGLFDTLSSSASPEAAALARRARAVIRQLIPDAVEEVDLPDRLVGFTFVPGTIKGLIVAITLQKTYVNIMFAKGVELMELDAARLLEGTGKVARHVKIRTADQLDLPDLHALILEAALRTPR